MPSKPRKAVLIAIMWLLISILIATFGPPVKDRYDLWAVEFFSLLNLYVAWFLVDVCTKNKPGSVPDAD